MYIFIVPIAPNQHKKHHNICLNQIMKMAFHNNWSVLVLPCSNCYLAAINSSSFTTRAHNETYILRREKREREREREREPIYLR